MTIFGKTLSEYVGFQKAILWFIAIVGLGRLVMSLAGIPNSTTKFISISVATLLGMLYVSYKLSKSQFGSYKQLLPLITIQTLTANIIIDAAIALAIFTGHGNIYSAPEYSGGVDGKTWGHAGAHLFLATTIVSLLGWAVGSLVLFISRKASGKAQVVPTQSEGKAKAAGAGTK